MTQLAQLIKGIGYVGELGDFTIKPLQQESLLLTGVCHHPASRLLPVQFRLYFHVYQNVFEDR